MNAKLTRIPGSWLAKLEISGCHAAVMANIRDRLSLVDPSAKFVLRKYPNMKWDGTVHSMDEHGVFGIGLRHHVLKVLKDMGDVSVEDCIDTSLSVPFHQCLSGVSLTPSQEKASKALLRHSVGCVEMDVSSGKSYILMNMAACVLRQHPDWRIVILVPRKALLYQLVQDARKVLPDHPIGTLGDGHRQFHNITIATAATAVARDGIKDQKQISDWMKEADVVMVDEAHHSSADTWRAIYSACPSKILWGVSAKFKFPASKKLLQRSIEAAFGKPVHSGVASEHRVPVQIHTYTFRDWDNALPSTLGGRLVDLTPAAFMRDGKWYIGEYRGPDEDGRIPPICTDDRGKPDKSKFGVYYNDKKVSVSADHIVYETTHDKGIMEFKDRDDWALALSCVCASKGEIFLVSCARDRHGKKLLKRWRDAGLVVERLSGSTSSNDLDRIMGLWANKQIDGVIAQYGTVSEGISIPSLYHFIKLDGQSGEMILHQQRGRPARREIGKSMGYLHLPMDTQHKKLLNNSQTAVKYFKRLPDSVPIVEHRYRNVGEFKEFCRSQL